MRLLSHLSILLSATAMMLSPALVLGQVQQEEGNPQPQSQDLVYASYVAAIDGSMAAQSSSASLSYARISEMASATTTPAWVKITSVPAFKSFSTPNAAAPVFYTTPSTQLAQSTQAATISSNGNNNALAIGLGVGLGGGAVLAVIAGIVVIARKRNQTRKSFEKRTATLAQRMSEAHV